MDRITVALNDYINMRSSSHYAVMITGAWGSGKTTYYMSNIHNELRKSKEYTPIYVSLYGLNSIEQLSRKILAERWVPEVANTALRSRSGQVVSELGITLLSTAVVNIPANFNIMKMPKRSVDIKKFLLFDSSTVICFDDLERTKIDLEELFGFINAFVERDGVKVVFLSNENDIELNREKPERYKQVKEKLIRITMTFEPNMDEAVPTIIEEATTHEASLKGFLSSHSDQVVNYCCRAGMWNLRIIKHALGMFITAWSELNDIPWINDDVRLKSLRFTMAIVNEYMAGKIKVDEFLQTKVSELRITFRVMANKNPI